MNNMEIDQLNFIIKMEFFYSLKDIVKKVENQATKWNNIAIHISEDIDPEYIKNFN